MNLKLSKSNPIAWLYGIGGLLLVVSVGVWCMKLSTNPERVFWATISQSLSTSAVTVQAEQNTGGTTANQTVQYSLGASNLARSLTTLSQPGTTVKNEIIATPTIDYSRYLSIKTDQKTHAGKQIDFSKVLGVWAKGGNGSGQFFAQAVFGASLPVGGMGVPIGNPGPTARAKLVKQIQTDGVYQIVFGKTKKERVAGHWQYTYEARVKPSAYVALMKHFAQSMGLHGLDQLDPQMYASRPAFTLLIVVDVRTRHVIQISAPDSGSKQTYSAYDVPVQMTLPTNTISGDELQQRLSTLQ